MKNTQEEPHFVTHVLLCLYGFAKFDGKVESEESVKERILDGLEGFEKFFYFLSFHPNVGFPLNRGKLEKVSL